MNHHIVRNLAVVAALSLGAAACGTDDGATVSQIPNDSAEASASASSGEASASASSGVAGGDDFETTDADGGYEYASDVSAHRLVSADICAINDALPSDGEIDFGAVETIYRDGLNSVNSDGSVRSIGGFAARDDRNPELQAFFGTTTPLDDFTSAALDGSGMFEGEPDLVRRQGVQKGIQNLSLIHI